jgi:hypothetical protein
MSDVDTSAAHVAHSCAVMPELESLVGRMRVLGVSYLQADGYTIGLGTEPQVPGPDVRYATPEEKTRTRVEQLRQYALGASGGIR